MLREIAVIYNEPSSGRYSRPGEEKAVLGVLDAVKAVNRALVKLGYKVSRTPLSPPLGKARETLQKLKADLIFNLFEGFFDSPESEPAVADMVAGLGIPYTGCPGTILALALDKARTKALLAASGISTPGYQVLSPETVSSFHLSFPCIVKPGGEDASIGLTGESVVHDTTALARQVDRISQLYGGRALVEEFVDGREFNITVLGTKDLAVLPISEIVFSLPPGLPRILTFDAKWKPKSPYFESTKAVCPAEIGSDLREEIGRIARQAFGLLGGSGYARVDFRVNDKGQPQVIEVNPNPDISPGTGAARQAKAAGMTYSQFIEKLIQLALESPVRIKVRPMTGEDKPTIMQILRDIPQFKPSEVVVAEEVLDSYLSNPAGSGYFALVAENGPTVAGYVCYGSTPLTEGTWDIYWLAVAPEQQGQGIGARLLAAAGDHIGQMQGRLLLAETSSKPEYEKTRRFYVSQGYQMIAQIADFYVPGDDKLIFQRRLK